MENIPKRVNNGSHIKEKENVKQDSVRSIENYHTFHLGNHKLSTTAIKNQLPSLQKISDV